jgi:tetratricopeptide (TPR) repeat protein
MGDTFTNLRVLPKDIPKAELEATMRGFAFALGVRCDHCHVAKADHSHPPAMVAAGRKLDFAADDRDEKKTARVMLRMVAAINRDYLGRIGKASPIRVECVTCHRGLTQPRTLNAILAEAAGKDGIEAAKYDFGETPLNQLTESLLHADKNKEAVAIMEMNFAANRPTSMWAYHMLAMAHEANGEIEKALADYRQVVVLHPDDAWAKQQIEALSARKK